MRPNQQHRHTAPAFAAAAIAVFACAAFAAPRAHSPHAAAHHATGRGAIVPVATPAPAGDYILDKAHSSLNFRVSHMGLSNFTARFTRLDGRLKFDPKAPTASRVEVDIDPASIQTNYPDPAYDFDAQLRGPDFFATTTQPKMHFRSTKVELTGPNTARITGELSLHGVTRPVVLEARFNGGYAANKYDPAGDRIGFSAHTSLKRSEFSMGYGVPAPGTSFGVGDAVEVLIECEFTHKG